MKDNKAELDARYCVVTLLYRGKIDEAQVALEAFTSDGTLSPDHAGFYQSLLSAARKQSEMPSPRSAKSPDFLRLSPEANVG